ncbi:MAG: 4-(cytidine 5'-diphospho)-2-C-methyl-D-erythritol kinase [Sphingomonadaceae bacterium]|nr:4-(cytidine 5'-diphospho)-2-C-methyl-D-erythritol kinase [Sphingomonadaceae bacterium]
MADFVTENAFAKVNLALHVRQRRPDGYHALESVFAFVDSGDELRASGRADGAICLTLSGPFADALAGEGDNLVLRAARALQAAAGVSAGADMHLQKNLPIASGIGGGSADAAATLRALVRLWQVDDAAVDLAAIAQSLGADVPACLASRTQFGSGVGELLTPCELGLSGRAILLINPMEPLATADVFRGWDGVDRGALDPAHWLTGRNDLTDAAIAILPEIADCLAVLRAQLPQVARMSGSGATCFAIFDSEAAAEAAAERIWEDHDWWVMAGKLR